MKKVSRRDFAKSAAIAPLGLAAASSLLGIAGAEPPSQAAATPAKHAPNPDAAADHIFFLDEAEPFAAPIEFARNPMQPKLREFALGEVTLESGPLQQARDWNRGYLMRLTNDRLLHNFRVNAGLPIRCATARRLGRSPTCELARPFCWPLSLRVFHALCGHRRQGRQIEGR